MENYDNLRAVTLHRVRDYFMANAESTSVPWDIRLDDGKREHVISIGTSIMMAKWKIGPTPGHFVQAVVDNDLSASINRADRINMMVLPFYVTLKENLSYSETI
jgi:hypothetical protein